MKGQLLSIAVILTGILLIYSQCLSQPEQNSSFAGTLTDQVYINNHPDTSIKLNLLIYKNYILEAQWTHHTISQQKLKNSMEQTPVYQSHKTLDNYFLLNLKNNSYTTFNTNVDSLFILGRHSINNAKPGFQVKEEIEQLKYDLDSIVAVKDTVIDKQLFKILERVRAAAGTDGVKKIRLFLNTDLSDFPFHPVSKKIDEQYGGTVLTVEYIADNGWTFSTGWKLTPLDKKEKQMIQRFIRIDERFK